MNGGKRTKTIIGTVFAGSVLLGAAACGTDSTESGTVAAERVPAPAGFVSPTMDPSISPGMGVGDMESLQKAGMAAVEAVEGSTLISISADEHGRIWEVHVVGTDGTEHSMDIEAASGNVVSGPEAEQDDAAEKAKIMALVKGAELTYKEAAEKAAESVPDGKVAELSLDRHMGKVAWEATVLGADGAENEIYVDAKDGTVIKNTPTG
ncbi:PepSY domain-containing protein [Nonomuraea sp. NPDC059194]|uniref:PepSY domain-containing protein n=1 Tax=Nonomuraea sp. NPDC059194 TaxID=3346764 RepID=UPI00368A7C9E